MTEAVIYIKPDLSEFPEKIKAVADDGTALPLLTMKRGEHYEVAGLPDDPKIAFTFSSSISA